MRASIAIGLAQGSGTFCLSGALRSSCHNEWELEADLLDYPVKTRVATLI
jgi:hypothetical protein